MLIKLAWRNIWRNRQRTLITAGSVLFAVLLASLMEALQKGAWNHMIGNVVNYYFGYAQVHSDGYWDDQTLDKAFLYEGKVSALQKEVSQVKNVLPRIESFALASSGDNTMGVMVVGVDPVLENEMTQLKTRLTKGNYLEGPKEALIAKGIAENLKININDTIVLISQGFRGVNAAGKYPVKGFVEFGSPDLNKRMVYLPLKEAQWFYGADNRVTSLAIHLKNPQSLQETVQSLKAVLKDGEYEVMDWKKLLPDLVEAKELDSAGNYIVYFILYVIIAFGIFGTILMMIKEREYEFGILVAIGMYRWKLGLIVWLETFFIGLLGTLAGILFSFPLVWYFHINPIRFTGEYAHTMEKFGFEPIFPAAFNANIFVTQAIIVFIITTVIAFFPLLKISRLKPVKAISG